MPSISLAAETQDALLESYALPASAAYRHDETHDFAAPATATITACAVAPLNLLSARHSLPSSILFE
jgi:hypothetical protein